MITRARLLAVFAAALLLGACAAATPPPHTGHGDHPTRLVHHHGQAIDMSAMLEALAGARAVLVGESHDRLDHHLNQLAILEQLYARQPDLVIGMEQFQQSAQPHLDDYVNRRIDTGALLLRSGWYRHWRYDFRLYAPILAFARRHRIAVIGLNIPASLTRQVAQGGVSALNAEQRARLPRLDRSKRRYRQRLERIYAQHPMGAHGGRFEHFYTAQLLWDESMAARAAAYLRANPRRRMVILAGNGHVEFGDGIPSRLARRIDGPVLTVVQTDAIDDQPTARADYLMASRRIELPARGTLGVLSDSHDGGARVLKLSDASAAGAAGLQPGDIVEALDGQPVRGAADLRARLWDRAPGDRVTVRVRRGDAERLTVEVTLR